MHARNPVSVVVQAGDSGRNSQTIKTPSVPPTTRDAATARPVTSLNAFTSLIVGCALIAGASTIGGKPVPRLALHHIDFEAGREPQPPEIIDPWFLWKLLINHRHQGKGYGREVVLQIVELVRGQGATELLASHVPGEGGPAGFHARLGFVPTGELDPEGETILRRIVHE